jgi:hypothetical protein
VAKEGDGMTTPEERLKILEEEAAVQQKGKELVELQKATADAQRAAAEAEKAATEAQKAAVEAMFPKGEAKPLAGEITTDADKFGYVAELVAYQAMKEGAVAVGETINQLPLSPKPVKILIVGERNFAQGDLPLLQLDKQFELLGDMLDAQIQQNKDLLSEAGAELAEAPSVAEREELPPVGLPESVLEVLPAAAITPALMAIPAVVSSVADIVGYFQVDYNIKGQDFELGSDALAAVVAGQIDNHEVHILNFHRVHESDMVKRFTRLIKRRQELEGMKELLRSQVVEPVTSEISAAAGRLSKLEDELKKLHGKTEEEQAQQLKGVVEETKKLLAAKNALLGRANAAVTESEGLGKAFGAFVNAVTSASDEGKPPLFVEAALRDHIRQQGITHLLHLSILSSGGEAITKKRLWSSGETAYIGGSAISYVLATSGGHIEAADTRVALAQLDYRLSAPSTTAFRMVEFTRQGA